MGRIWPDTVSFENREGAKEGRQPLGAGKSKETDSVLEAQERNAASDILILVQ